MVDPNAPKPPARAAQLIAPRIIVVLLVVATAGVLAISTLLRPIADDYCQGSTAAQGFIPSIGIWLSTWSGDAFQVAVTAALVGQPLAGFPLSLASAIPFAATAAAVVACLVLSLRSAHVPTSTRRTERWTYRIGVAAMIALLWWGFWWVGGAANGDGSASWLLATAVLHWQVVNVQYVLVPVTVVAAFLVIADRTSWPRPVQWLAFLLLGIVGGLSGIVLAGAIVVFVPLLIAWRLTASGAPRRRLLEQGILLEVGAVAGLTVAYFAPGARARSAVLAATGEQVSIPQMVGMVLPDSLVRWWGAIIEPGTIVVFVAVVLVGYVSARAGLARAEPGRLVTIALAFIAFSMVIQMAAAAGDAFSYPAYWHDVMPRTFVFLGVVLAGLAAGARLSALRQRVAVLVAVLAGLTSAAILAGALYGMAANTYVRYLTWNEGAAPMGAADIEVEWVQDCWDELLLHREAPVRG